MIYGTNNTKDQRPKLKAYLKEMEFKRVLDVGGADNPWMWEYVTAYIDLREPHTYLEHYPNNILKDALDKARTFIGDVNEPEGWEGIEQDVADNGKYDFAICSHVLEDIRNPPYVVKQLPKIAKAGYVAFPSVHWELGIDTELLTHTPEDKRLEEWGITGTFRGFMHHRWILTVKDGVLWLFPKFNILEVIEGFEWVKHRNSHHELTFWWKDEIPMRMFRDDYMGANGGLVCQEYREQLTPEDFDD